MPANRPSTGPSPPRCRSRAPRRHLRRPPRHRPRPAEGGEEAPVSTVDWARLQFATTSIYHFLFVPLTIGLAFLTALLQTRWHRTDEPAFLRLTRFFGALLVINVAVGVVTGLVQEFQFGTNWSGYSRFV